jgi:hypothetical protein
MRSRTANATRTADIQAILAALNRIIAMLFYNDKASVVRSANAPWSSQEMAITSSSTARERPSLTTWLFVTT